MYINFCAMLGDAGGFRIISAQGVCPAIERGD